MLHFGQFALPSEKQGSVKRDLIWKSRDHRSHALSPGLSQLATSFIAYQAESFPNRRLCTIPGTPFFYLLLQPRKLYANISVKPHNFHSVSYYADIVAYFPVILYTTVIADHSAPSFIPHKNRELHIQYFSHMNTQDNPLHKVARTVKLRR